MPGIAGLVYDIALDLRADCPSRLVKIFDHELA